MTERIHYAPLHELSDGLARGEYTSEELARTFLDRIEKIDPEINSYITVQEEDVLRMARAADERRRKGEG